MNEVHWEDPGPPTKGQERHTLWRDRLEPLKAQPGRWALLAEKPSRAAASTSFQNLRRRVLRVPDGDWEFTYRRRGEGWALYGRYLTHETSGEA